MQRKARQERPTASETVRPSEVQEVGDSEEVTTRDVQHLLKHLKSAISRSPEKRVNYFRFLVHPESFAQTVENIFHFSFLIKVSVDRYTFACGVCVRVCVCLCECVSVCVALYKVDMTIPGGARYVR